MWSLFVKMNGSIISTDLGGSSNHSNELSFFFFIKEDLSFEERSG